MAWVKLDDQFPDHPKIVQAGPLAGWLHICAIAYCNRFLTDGFVPAAQVPRLADFAGLAEVVSVADGLAGMGSDVEPAMLADRLVAFGVWEQAVGGYLIHNYLDFQPSKAEVEARRKQRVSAGRRGGLAKAKRTASDTLGEREANGVAESCPVPVPVPVPKDIKSPSDLGNAASNGGQETASTKGDGLLPRLVGAVRQHGLEVELEAQAVLSVARQHLDDRLIDEGIGQMVKLEKRAERPVYLLTLLNDWSTKRGLQVPEMRLPRRVAS